MIKLISLTIKNFMSIGNVTQSINFDSCDLVLVLGENLDLGGNDNRNGVGKSTIVNALSYVLYGSALTNIKKDNLINKTNLKNMLVTLTFEVNGINYKIERGRKPGIFKFIKNGVDVNSFDKESENESQGENRHTQIEIEKLLGFSHDMFKHILALNTYVEPFLSLKSADQRIIIEQLLGITKLSEKADKLKEELKLVKDNIKEEEFKISAANEANKRIESNIQSLEIKSAAWIKSKEKKIDELQNSIVELMSLDIENEIQLHKNKKEAEDITYEYKTLFKEFLNIENEVLSYSKSISKLDEILKSSSNKICPTCNQEMDKHTHIHVQEKYNNELEAEVLKLNEAVSKRDELKIVVDSVSSLIPEIPTTYYKTLEEAFQHKNKLDQLGNRLSIEIETINPYVDQIESLKKNALQQIDFTLLNELVSFKDHQEFLLKLLTSKDSFIRKKIIDQNLSFLNQRLRYYLSEIGLPHNVIFQSDLEVEITIYGKDFDFDNLSRGERTRLILSLSWAFRDVFESMNDKINLLFIDELVDNGIDSAGTESVLKILKEMSRMSGKNIFLISHRDEFTGRVSNVLKVIKEGGFTSIESINTKN